MDTEPLPAVPSARPPRRLGGLGRTLELIAGALSAGLLLVGLGLVAIEVFAPMVWPSTGIAAAQGPGWGRATAHVVAGALGETLVGVRSSLRRPARVWGAAGMTALAVAVLWWCWWN